jgi:outer membrane protein assembly factor BamD (BamD/ComL family)
MLDELAALDEARAAIRNGAARRALALLDDYDRRFPRPELGLEARIVRIEALVAAGDLDRARELADRFLAAHPSSPSAARIRRLVDR